MIIFCMPWIKTLKLLDLLSVSKSPKNQDSSSWQIILIIGLFCPAVWQICNNSALSFWQSWESWSWTMINWVWGLVLKALILIAIDLAKSCLPWWAIQIKEICSGMILGKIYSKTFFIEGSSNKKIKS